MNSHTPLSPSTQECSPKGGRGGGSVTLQGSFPCLGLAPEAPYPWPPDPPLPPNPHCPHCPPASIALIAPQPSFLLRLPSPPAPLSSIATHVLWESIQLCWDPHRNPMQLPLGGMRERATEDMESTMPFLEHYKVKWDSGGEEGRAQWTAEDNKKGFLPFYPTLHISPPQDQQPIPWP